MELRPFRSIRFSPRVLKARGLSAVFAPPYDQISPLGQERLYGQAPENIVRITCRKKDGEDAYAGAAKTLADWLADGTLEKEKRPALWIYRQTFSVGGETVVRDALVGLVRLEEYETGTIRPHERTLAKPKADRLALLAATKADLELVFLLTRAPLADALDTRRSAQLSAMDPDGVRHDAFRISDYGAHVELQGLVKNAEAIIADGHHRYETALAFSKDPAAAKLPGARYKLCAIVDMASPGLVVRPIHRLLSGLPDWNPERLLGGGARLLRSRTARFRAPGLRRSSEALAHAPGLRPLRAPGAAHAARRCASNPLPCRGPRGARRPGRASTSRPSRSPSSTSCSASTRMRSPGASTCPSPPTPTSAIAAVEKKEAQAAVLMRPTTVVRRRGRRRRGRPAAPEVHALLPEDVFRHLRRVARGARVLT